MPKERPKEKVINKTLDGKVISKPLSVAKEVDFSDEVRESASEWFWRSINRKGQVA